MVQLRNRVKELRRRRYLSQANLAELSGVGQATISNIETNRYVPRVDIAIKIASALQEPTDSVFFFTTVTDSKE